MQFEQSQTIHGCLVRVEMELFASADCVAGCTE